MVRAPRYPLTSKPRSQRKMPQNGPRLASMAWIPVRHLRLSSRQPRKDSLSSLSPSLSLPFSPVVDCDS
eukprot:11386224-Alexandrium_andersonii.AAC.1